MTATLLKLKPRKKTTYENRLLRAVDTVRKEGRKVRAVGFFIRTKDFTYYECRGCSSDMIVGVELLKREIMDFAMSGGIK